MATDALGDPIARRVYREHHIGGTLRRGSRPAVLVVDLQRGFTEPGGPVGCDLTEPVLATRALLDDARRFRVPVIFTVIGYAAPSEAGVWLQKMPGLGALRRGGDWTDLDPRLARRDDEPVVVKHGASALHRTDVAARLTSMGADTVVVAGATTSGCVRASVVDLLQEGFPTLVVAECCGDRAAAPHAASLFDMAAKYADVVTVGDATRYLEQGAPER